MTQFRDFGSGPALCTSSVHQKVPWITLCMLVLYLLSYVTSTRTWISDVCISKIAEINRRISLMKLALDTKIKVIQI